MMAFADYDLATSLLLSLDIPGSSGVWARLLLQPSQAGGATRPCLQGVGGWAAPLQLPGPCSHFLGAGQESSVGPLADSRRIMAEVAAWRGRR